jgi:ribosomal protein S12 methylthiotransferase accessory factor
MDRCRHRLWTLDDEYECSIDQAIRAAATGDYVICSWRGADCLSPGDIVVSCRPRSKSASLKSLEEVVKPAGAFLLPITSDRASITIGPVVGNSASCLRCLELRRDGGAHESRVGTPDIPATEKIRFSPLLRHLLIAVIDRYLAPRHVNTPASAWEHTIHVLNLQTCSAQSHRYTPHPECEKCQRLQLDCASSALLSLTPRQKYSISSCRVRRLEDYATHVVRNYVDSQVGIIKSVTSRLTIGAIAVVSSELGQRDAAEAVHGFGSSTSYDSARTISVIEALERYAGFFPRGRNTAVYTTFEAVRNETIDPETLGLHSHRECTPLDSELIPYSHHLETEHVWAYSFGREKPLLIPEQFVYYYNRNEKRPSPRFVVTTSSGCATGGSLEEAIVHGVVELIERDAFLLTWYQRRQPRSIHLDSVSDTTNRFQLAKLADLGFDVFLSDITTEFNVPCILCLVKGRATDCPSALCVAGAALGAEIAIGKALTEITANLTRFSTSDPHVRAKAEELAKDPDRVRQMEDHALLYTCSEAARSLDFLAGGTPSVTVSEVDARANWGHSTCVFTDLRQLVGRLASHNMDLLVVDQTPPEQRAADLFTVRTLVPGLIPMTFGNRLRRLVGLPRLLRRPGGSPQDPSTLNRLPHPFL